MPFANNRTSMPTTRPVDSRASLNRTHLLYVLVHLDDPGADA